MGKPKRDVMGFMGGLGVLGGWERESGFFYSQRELVLAGEVKNGVWTSPGGPEILNGTFWNLGGKGGLCLNGTYRIFGRMGTRKWLFLQSAGIGISR